MTPKRTTAIGVAMLVSALAAAAGGAQEPPVCTNFQSGRNISRFPRSSSPFNGESRTSMVISLAKDGSSLEYRPRCDGPVQTLKRCGQHFHCHVENVQGCPGETPTPPGGTPAPCGALMGGNRIEVHTVYSAVVKESCDDPEGLTCCLVGPVVVLGFMGTVTGDNVGGRIPTPFHFFAPGRPDVPLAEWSGSATGPDKPKNECKIPVQWSFALGCGVDVSLRQLHENFKLPQEARPLQTGNRVSKDLTLISSHP